MKALELKIVPLILIVIIFIACKSSDVDGTHITHKPTTSEINKINNVIDSLISNNASDLDESTKKFIAGLLKKAVESPETFTSDLEKAIKYALYVYPNPTSGSITVEFMHDFPFEIDRSNMQGVSLDLYYSDKQIATLKYNNIKNSKVIISADYLQKEGTYTIFLTGNNNVHTSFVVKK